MDADDFTSGLFCAGFLFSLRFGRLPVVRLDGRAVFLRVFLDVERLLLRGESIRPTSRTEMPARESALGEIALESDESMKSSAFPNCHRAMRRCPKTAAGCASRLTQMLTAPLVPTINSGGQEDVQICRRFLPARVPILERDPRRSSSAKTRTLIIGVIGRRVTFGDAA